MTWTYATSTYSTSNFVELANVYKGQLIIVGTSYQHAFLTPGSGISVSGDGNTYYPVNTSCPTYSSTSGNMFWAISNADFSGWALTLTSTGNVAQNIVVSVFSGSDQTSPLDYWECGFVPGGAQTHYSSDTVSSSAIDDLNVIFWFQDYTTMSSPYWSDAGGGNPYVFIIQQNLFGVSYLFTHTAAGIYEQIITQTATIAGSISAVFRAYHPEYMMGILE
jgi:hypothetical protein